MSDTGGGLGLWGALDVTLKSLAFILKGYRRSHWSVLARRFISIFVVYRDHFGCSTKIYEATAVKQAGNDKLQKQFRGEAWRKLRQEFIRCEEAQIRWSQVSRQEHEEKWFHSPRYGAQSGWQVVLKSGNESLWVRHVEFEVPWIVWRLPNKIFLARRLVNKR